MSTNKAELVVSDETGLQRALGYVNHIFADRTETHLTMDDRHTNRHGTLHGGIFTMLLDSACGFSASRALSDDASQKVVTLTLTVNYLAQPKSDHVYAVGKVSRAGGSVVYSNGEVFDDEGTLLATGSGVFKRVRG